MQKSPPQSPLLAPAQPENPEKASSAAQIAGGDEPTSSSLFDWSDFLEFNLDENLTISFPQQESESTESQQPEKLDSDRSGRVRKRDPRLVCTNFLAGRVPCACPELDEQLAAEEAALPGKKRTRVARVSGGAPARCQVQGCEADISELKGYHRRHRVCLRCANASEVVIEGESKRYCQQCGKFHLLSDFDEGKRSCRRKLERHNNRRRRKPNESKEVMEKESEQIILGDDVSCDDDTGKDGICTVSSQNEEREILLESDGHASTLGSQSLQSDSLVSFGGSGEETRMNRDRENPKSKRSPSDCENKSSFSSMCPTGRISFKLYDWNPAEFPRRLRHQIFQWLASMPVELEGYIRPGCTILTAFIAMPKPAWSKLLEEPALCIKNLVASPGSMLSGKGTMHVFLNDMIFRVTKEADATSVVKIKVKDQCPKLHYIYPTCFEAGRPMEFVACGSYLLQPNFRFLVSFAGRYLAYNICVSTHSEKRDANKDDHQFLKIYIPETDKDIFGPAFVEVENQSGFSNFIPILVSDKETCAEIEILQQKFDVSLSSQEQKLLACDFALRQAQFSEFIQDVAWLLKKPVPEQRLTPTNIQRFNHLLNFLIEKESYVVLARVFRSLRFSMDNNLVASSISDSDMRLLQKNLDIAQKRLARKLLEKDISVIPQSDGSFYSYKSRNDTLSGVAAGDQGVLRTVKNILGFRGPSSPSLDESATVPLLKNEVIMTIDIQERPRSCSRALTTKFLTSRLLIMAIAAVGVCFGVCAVALHPQGVGQLALTMRKCLFRNS